MILKPLDGFGGSGVILIENYGNYLFCYTLSSLHILTQNQITNKYYRLLLSENRSDNEKKLNLILKIA